MKELAGRLSSLDPEASQSLKVIAYFDTLVHGRVGAEGMLRGAAVLCGAPIGHLPDGAAVGRRFDPAGGPATPGSPTGWPTAPADDGSSVWLERTGPAHANDEMVLERLALAISVTSMRIDARAPGRRAVEVLLSGDSTPEQREEASARLSLATHPAVYAIAVPSTVALERPLANATIASPYGIVRGVLAPSAEAPASRAGIGTAALSTDQLRESWRSALVALRLADDERPIVRADELGALLTLAELEDQRATPHPDVLAIESVIGDIWSERMLSAIAAGVSHRQLAIEAGVHHSTIAVRLQDLPRRLSYDPATPTGRTRLDVALMLHRLARVRFDGP